jgi:5-formyltetrahydrofolate cyclo-ligase
VFWDLLSPQKLGQIHVLRQLKQEIEEREKLQLPSGPDEVLPPTASRGKNKGKKKRETYRNPSTERPREKPQAEKGLKNS